MDITGIALELFTKVGPSIGEVDRRGKPSEIPFRDLILQRFGTPNELQDLPRDRCLACLVVRQLQLLDQAADNVGGLVHGGLTYPARTTFDLMVRWLFLLLIAPMLLRCGDASNNIDLNMVADADRPCLAANILVVAPDSFTRMPGLDTMPLVKWHEELVRRTGHDPCDDHRFVIPIEPETVWAMPIDGVPLFMAGDCDISCFWPHRHFSLFMEHDGTILLHDDTIAIAEVGHRFHQYFTSDSERPLGQIRRIGGFLGGVRMDPDSLQAVQVALLDGISKVFDTVAEEFYGAAICDLHEDTLRVLAGRYQVSISILPLEDVGSTPELQPLQ